MVEGVVPETLDDGFRYLHAGVLVGSSTPCASYWDTTQNTASTAEVRECTSLVSVKICVSEIGGGATVRSVLPIRNLK